MNKRVLLVSSFLVLLGGFFVYEKFGLNQKNQASGNNPSPQTAVPITQTTTGFKDGTYVGLETSSMYGKAKAQIIIAGGKITDVQFLEYPNDRQATTIKSNMAMPIIKQEVIQSQSANVNTVSGATQTSESFIQSISSALSQAS